MDNILSNFAGIVMVAMTEKASKQTPLKAKMERRGKLLIIQVKGGNYLKVPTITGKSIPEVLAKVSELGVIFVHGLGLVFKKISVKNHLAWTAKLAANEDRREK